jgi:hypothetical protein
MGGGLAARRVAARERGRKRIRTRGWRRGGGGLFCKATAGGFFFQNDCEIGISSSPWTNILKHREHPSASRRICKNDLRSAGQQARRRLARGWLCHVLRG